MDRRSFLKTAGITGVGAIGAILIPWDKIDAAESVLPTYEIEPAAPVGPALIPAYWDKVFTDKLRSLGHPQFKSGIQLPHSFGTHFKLRKSTWKKRLDDGWVEKDLKKYAVAYSFSDLNIHSRYPHTDQVTMAIHDIARDISHKLKHDRIEWLPSPGYGHVIIKALGSSGAIDPDNCCTTVAAKVWGIEWPF